MAGNDGSFGGPWRYNWQPGMTRKPDWLTVLGYTNPELAEVLALRPALVAFITKCESERGED